MNRTKTNSHFLLMEKLFLSHFPAPCPLHRSAAGMVSMGVRSGGESHPCTGVSRASRGGPAEPQGCQRQLWGPTSIPTPAKTVLSS